MLKISGLEVSYGIIKAINGISFEVKKGEFVALIGTNGAGKTTVLHTITGLIRANAGSILFEERKSRLRGRFRAVNSRCLQWAGRLCPIRK